MHQCLAAGRAINPHTHTHKEEKQKVLNTRHGAAISNNISKYKNNTQQQQQRERRRRKNKIFPICSSSCRKIVCSACLW
jgi:hypothetical protein